MPYFLYKPQKLGRADPGSSGFILLEVLVAMSLIASSWITIGGTYQQMALRLGKSQEQRVQIKKEADQYELTLVAAGQLKREMNSIRGLVNEPSRVSRRFHHIPDSGGTTDKK